MPLQQKHNISHAVVLLFTYAGQLIHLGLCGNSISTNHDIFIVEKTPPRLYKLRKKKKSSHLKLPEWY